VSTDGVDVGRAGTTSHGIADLKRWRLAHDGVWPGLGILLALAGGGLVLWSSRWGLGLRSDSAVYVAAARNLLDGHGLSWLSGGGEVRPMTLHAPLLPILLAAAEAMGVDAVSFARLLNSACLGLAILLVGAIALRATRSRLLAASAALVMAVTGEVYRVHVWLMSEPLFIALTLAGALALLRHRDSRTPLWLLVSSGAFGLAGLTRYGGLALAVAGAGFLILDPAVPWRRRLAESAVMLALGIGPTAVWMARNQVLTGQTGGRTFGLHFDLWPMLRDQAFEIIANWFAPLRLVEWIADRPGAIASLFSVAAFGLALTGALLLRRRFRKGLLASDAGSGLVLLGACLLSYLAVTFGAAVFTSPGADVDERVLSPVYPLAWLVMVCLLGWAWSRGRIPGKLAVGLLLILLVRNKVVYTYWTLRELSADGLGYSSRAWQTSATIRSTVERDPGVIFTNDTAAIYLLAQRVSYLVPWALPGYDPASAAQIEAGMLEVLGERDGIVVLFGGDGLPADWSGEGMGVAEKTDDGVILSPASGEPG
jgi:4-amino-4-deoxy-L-arabinose transferase-like glycosyltransferase